MNNVVLRFVFDRKKESSKTKQALLHIEARLQGSSDRVLIRTGVKLYENQFSDKMGFTCRNHPLADAITKKANDILTQVTRFALSDKCKSLKDIKNWNDDQSKHESVLLFIEKEMRLRNMEYNTLKAHVTLTKKLEALKEIQTFNDLTYSNILAFDQAMRKSNLSNVSINKMHSLFKMYIRLAVNKDLISKNPYDRFTPPKAKNADPVFLSIEEVHKIINVKDLNEKLDKTRDLFIFQCFTGMAYVDTQQFSHDDIQIINGEEVIRSSRTKTDESFILLFLPEAKLIAEKYSYSLPKISNQKYNDYLKLLIAHPDINISKKVTSHTARHTFATYLLNRGLSLETVSKTLGHSNIKQTQHYARLLGKKVIDDMKKLL